jgi:hypothetical protein
MPQISAPPGSRILLIETEQIFTARIQASFEFEAVGLVFSAIIWDILVFIFTVMFSLMSGNEAMLFALFVVIPFWLIGLWITLNSLFICFGLIHLQIDSKYLSINYELFGFKSSMLPAPRSSIQKLEYTPVRYETDSEGEKKVIPRRIIIWAADRSYEPLNGFEGLGTFPISSLERD